MTELIELQRKIGRVLSTWSVSSIILGIILSFISPGTILGGIGLQAIIWGIIDLFIAAYILFKQKIQSIEQVTKTVSVNIYLDILYQVIGLIVIVMYLQNPYFVGNGIGVIIQGFFLLLLDRTYHNGLTNLEKGP